MWLDQFQFAGFYIAKEKGFYEDIGLDVELKKYNSSINVLDEVLNKRADFGTNSSSLIIDKSNGNDIVLLGSVFQSSPLILLALKDSKLQYLEDIKNKTLMISKEQQRFATLKSMLSSKGVELSDMKLIEHSYGVDDLINKKADVMLAYTTNEPFLLKEKGYESTIFNPKDYGFDFYEEIIFTSKEFAKENPKLVKDFYKATIKGWEYAFENIDETVNLIYKKYNSQNKSLQSLRFEANEMKKLAYDKNGKIGTITPEKINLIVNTYRIMGAMNNKIDVNDLIYTNPLNDDFLLNDEEKRYLEKKEKITMCVDPNWMPLEKIENNKHIGIAADYIKIIENKIKTPIVLIPTKTWSESIEKGKKRECDIFSLVMTTPEREKYLNFTKPFLNIPVVLASNINAPFIDNIDQIKHEKLAIVKDYAYAEIFKIKFPNINFIDVVNVKEGLKKVEKGEVFGFIGSLATVGYEIQNNYIGQLKITGKFDETLDLAIASRNDEAILNTILNKAIEDIPSIQRQEILNKWISINYPKELDYKLLIPITIFLFILVLIYRQYLLKKLNKKLLEKVKLEIQKNEEKNRILIQQSRMASMGEMLENIAHQWRQPLSTISVCATGMEVKKRYNTLDDEEFFKSINHIKKSTLYLSNTIDDFRNFFSKEKILTKINISNVINKALDLVSTTFNSNKIVVVKHLEDINILSLENELIQVFMNIFVNAKDALKEQKQEQPLLIITITKENGFLNIKIQDNANGIKEDIIDKIFEPYFTTKHKFKGTGIGLYMSKLLVEKHLNGSLLVSNKTFVYEEKEYFGAEFIISLPLENFHD
ncbi:MAG: ABC transporter substrate-binding protein [Arcobacter sp.]|jgi:ABC-type nitrate/sulfonate/bicarbonate transport system substrate-binding protein/signal transduction histidine kinase|uniref:ABC transporter substrate-binding protein n=1 Tax=Arcobacter sp. TaxID=1872629 RepID=UPI002A74AC01|nr:ABC transporter substrate-binding protein [Arcobacter sp.]MDY3203583.1 ABC transporter substrate-binding protein [Arcobacter sp.]